jgi:hypothetical protein
VPYEAFLIQTVEARPALTMPELAARLLEEHGVVAAPAMLSRFLCRCGFSYKKALMAAECARADVRDERRVWHAHRQPRMREQPHRLIVLDETDVNTKMTRLRGRSRKGQRLRMSAPFGHWTTHTFLAGLRCNELCAPWVIDGPITRLAFECLIPGFDGAFLSPEWRDALWARFSMGAPQRSIQSVEQSKIVKRA